MKKQTRLKISYISGSYPPIRDGVGFYLQKLTNHLPESDYAIVTSEGAVKNQHTQPVITSWGKGVDKQVVHAINHLSPSLIHMQYSSIRYGRSLGSTLLPRTIQKAFRSLPFVITIHEYHDASWLGRKRVELMLRPVEHIIVSNHQDHHQLQQKFPKKSIYQIPIGSNIDVISFTKAELEKFRHTYNPNRKKLILNWGLLDENKGIDKLIAAVAELDEGVKLLIASGLQADNPYHQRLQKQIKSSGADIDWLGFLDDRTISALLQISDLVVLPFNQPVSLRRGSVLASLAHAKPVITTGPSEDPELEDRRNCYLLSDNQPDSIRTAIEELLDDPKLVRLITTQAKILANHFNWGQIAARHEEIYQKLTH